MKGFDLLAKAADRLAQENMLLLILGIGEPYYENLLRELAERYPNRFAVRIAYDETLAHKILAGSDMVLMLSRSEPCGLNQIYGMKYGTVPVVRETGGLDDSVDDWNPESGEGTGFKFHGYEPENLMQALGRAFAAFSDKPQWRKIMLNGMSKDFSWTVPAERYIQIYQEIVRRRS
jgi:starch synthase